MFKGYALYYALILILFISLMLGSVILMLQFNTQELNDLLLRQRVQLNAQSGLRILLTNEDVPNNSTIDLFGDNEDQVLLKRKWWGGYEILESIANKSRYSHRNIVLAGKEHRFQDYGLYVSDRNEPLVLIGQAEITGTSYVPKRGVKQGHLEGTSFQGQNLINGVILKSEKKLPEANESYLDNITKYIQGIFEPFDSIVASETDKIPDTLSNSYHDKTLILSLNTPSSISQNISGNIIIHCFDSLNITANSDLDGILIIAQTVRVQSGVKGSFQVFAAKSITIERDCELQYPTMLNLIANSNNKQPNFIEIHESVNIKGDILIYGTSSKAKPSYLYLGSTSNVTGIIYVRGQIELRGKVTGSITCNEFILHTAKGTYLNHILDGKIDESRLPEEFVPSRMLLGKGNKKVIKWLN